MSRVSSRTRSTEDVPPRLRPFVVDRAGEDLIGVTEAASRLGVSRTTVYDWVARNTLIAWRSTQRRLNIPSGQIVGPGRVTDGLAEVVEVVGEPELAWTFLSQEWPFEDGWPVPLNACGPAGSTTFCLRRRDSARPLRDRKPLTAEPDRDRSWSGQRFRKAT